MIYPDLAFTLSLLVQGEHTAVASSLVRDSPHPLNLSLVHRLQVENGLLRAFYGRDPNTQKVAKDGLLLWRQYVQEDVFSIQTADLEAAFAQAATWNANYRIQPPRWGLLVHVAIATEMGATFLSFHPALRKVAADTGLTLLPERL